MDSQTPFLKHKLVLGQLSSIWNLKVPSLSRVVTTSNPRHTCNNAPVLVEF